MGVNFRSVRLHWISKFSDPGPANRAGQVQRGRENRTPSGRGISRRRAPIRRRRVWPEAPSGGYATEAICEAASARKLWMAATPGPKGGWSSKLHS
jgi:hypothetical protein